MHKLPRIYQVKIISILILSLLIVSCATLNKPDTSASSNTGGSLIVLGAILAVTVIVKLVAAVADKREQAKFKETIQEVADTSSLELQAIQTRTFDASIASATIATLNTLTDLGIAMNANSFNTGLTVTGKGTITFNDIEIPVETSVLLSEVDENQSRIRISLVAKDNAIVGNPDIYNLIFDRINLNLFTEHVL